MEENFPNKDDIYDILASNENHDEFFNKKIIKIRKEYSTINSNSSICIVENDQKKINYEIKDNKNFLNKSHLQSNINDLKDKLNPIENEKNRPNSSKIEKRTIKENLKINEEENLKNENGNTERNENQNLRRQSEDNLIFSLEKVKEKGNKNLEEKIKFDKNEILLKLGKFLFY